MEQPTIRKFKLFMPWQDHEEETWLSKMARQGWHLSFLFPLFYTFTRGEPREEVYHLDYASLSKEAFDEYLHRFRASGWEHIGSKSGWQYFRIPSEAHGGLESEPDASSKIRKYRRNLRLFTTFLVIYLVLFLANLPSPYALPITLLILFWGYAMMRIFLRMRHLARL